VTEPMRVPFGFATFVELHGQYQGEHMPTHLFAAIVQIPDDSDGIYQTWFFKLAGDQATVDADANRLAVAQMVFSLRPQGSPKPDLSSIEEKVADESEATQAPEQQDGPAAQDQDEEPTDTP